LIISICLSPRRATFLPENKGAFMFDVVMLALGLGFFALAIGYGYARERR
jgi:hypothetical protein